MKKRIIICFFIMLVSFGGIILYANFQKEKTKTTWLSYEDLSEKQKQNLHYLFGEKTETICPVSATDTLLDDEEAYKGYSYSEVNVYHKEQILYGPDNHEKQVNSTLSRNDIIEKAKEKTDLVYEEILVAKDQEAKKWRITFWTQEKNQRVYLYEDGTINLVTAVLDNEE